MSTIASSTRQRAIGRAWNRSRTGSRIGLSALLIVGLALGGCNVTKQQTGQVVGAVAGGALGSRFGQGSGKTAAIIAGTIAGAYLGGYLGRQMDENDRQRTYNALEYNHSNQSSSWTNPDSGYDYSVTPTRTYETSAGPCRDYTTEAYIDGRRESVHGTACRDADGRWYASNS